MNILLYKHMASSASQEIQEKLKINEVCCVCNKFISEYIECKKCKLAVFCNDVCFQTSAHVCREDSPSLRLMRHIVTLLSNKLNHHEGFHKAYERINKSRNVRRLRTPRLLVILIDQNSKICDILDNIEKYIKITTMKEIGEVFNKYSMPFPTDWKNVTGVVLYADATAVSFGIIGS
jgi:hypothetical protein